MTNSLKPNPLPGFENMTIQIFMNDRPFILEDLLKSMCGIDAKLCTNKEHQQVPLSN